MGRAPSERMRSESETNPTGARHWFRVLRPLLWWLLLVLAMYAYRTHERLTEKTRLSFSIQPDGEWSAADARITLDGARIWQGQRVPLGRHRLEIAHEK